MKSSHSLNLPKNNLFLCAFFVHRTQNTIQLGNNKNINSTKIIKFKNNLQIIGKKAIYTSWAYCQHIYAHFLHSAKKCV